MARAQYYTSCCEMEPAVRLLPMDQRLWEYHTGMPKGNTRFVLWDSTTMSQTDMSYNVKMERAKKENVMFIDVADYEQFQHAIQQLADEDRAAADQPAAPAAAGGQAGIVDNDMLQLCSRLCSQLCSRLCSITCQLWLQLLVVKQAMPILLQQLVSCRSSCSCSSSRWRGRGSSCCYRQPLSHLQQPADLLVAHEVCPFRDMACKHRL